MLTRAELDAMKRLGAACDDANDILPAYADDLPSDEREAYVLETIDRVRAAFFALDEELRKR